MPSTEAEYVLFDAGVFIGALLIDDSRHTEARPLVETARRGDILACTALVQTLSCVDNQWHGSTFL